MQETGAGEVTKIFGPRTGKLGIKWCVSSFGQRKENPGEFLIRATERLNHKEINIVRGLHDPVAFADSDKGAGLTGKSSRHEVSGFF